MEPYLGGRGRVSEVLNSKRPLTLDMIRKLHEGLGIPLESLIGGTKSSGKKSRLIGIWKNNPKVRDVSAYIDGLRSSRY